MYSPRSRWRRSARLAALLRNTSRSFRQAIYAEDPTVTLFTRHIASSSSPSVETGVWLRCAQEQRARASSVSAVGTFNVLNCIDGPILGLACGGDLHFTPFPLAPR